MRENTITRTAARRICAAARTAGLDVASETLSAGGALIEYPEDEHRARFIGLTATGAASIAALPALLALAHCPIFSADLVNISDMQGGEYAAFCNGWLEGSAMVWDDTLPPSGTPRRGYILPLNDY